ncbi:MAG TPA: PKD domain-containing protein [Gemmatimonadales bacterium]|jgi:PKD repeat protein|nr:PKD domain-containing protein [Gemmatimonadales bacterium]
MAAFLLGGCGGGSSLLLPGDGVANHIKIAAGNNQSGRVGEPLTDPLVAEVTDSRGRPVEGVSVAFAFTSGAPGAEITPSTATTDAKGEAPAQVVLGTTIGPQTGEASIVTDGGGGTAPSTSFTLMAVPRDANGIAVASGDDQSGKAGSKLRQPLVVQVTDAFGNPISGVPIDWSSGGGGSVSDASNTTDENGLASVERTLGPAAGKQTTQASSPGLAGSPVTFTHTATAGSASTLTIISGNNQTAKVGTKLPADLVVQLLDGEGNGVPKTAVTWVVAIGGGSVTPQNGTTDDQGVATAQWTLGPNPGSNRVDAVVSGVGVANFSATGTSAVPSTVTTTTEITGDSPDPSVSGSPFTVEIRVTSPGPVPTGTVRVTADGAQANCTVTLQNGAGSCSLTLNREGDRTLRATYSGASGFKASSATAAHKVVGPQQQNRPPHADYNWTCTGLTCQFTDHSSDPDGNQTLASWSWTFGDGGTSPDRNPTHTFPGPGSYLVALTVNDNAGGSNTATAHVDVQGPPPPPANKAPHAEFEVHCTDQTCSFTDRSRDDDGSIASWRWDFGDGQGSTEQNPSHFYAVPGHYNVTLTVTDNAGASDSRSHDANPSAPPPPSNGAPTAFPDDYTTNEGGDQTLTIGAAQGVLANDTDPEHDPLTASLASGPSNGTVNLRSDGSFDYTPNSSFFGDDGFSYRASDPAGGSSTATVTIHVQPVNDSPRFSSQGNVTVPQDAGPQSIGGWAFNISPGAANESGQTLTFIVTQNDNPGLFADGPAISRDGAGDTGTLSFTPAAAVNGTANITVVLKDDGGTANGGSDTSAPQSFTITVEQPPAPPPSSDGRISR